MDTYAIRETLTKCRDRFEEYEKSHADKRTADGYMKAARNAEMVKLCNDTIALIDLERPDSAAPF